MRTAVLVVVLTLATSLAPAAPGPGLGAEGGGETSSLPPPPAWGTGDWRGLEALSVLQETVSVPPIAADLPDPLRLVPSV